MLEPLKYRTLSKTGAVEAASKHLGGGIVRALFHNPVYPILHQALKHPTNWDAAPHPQHESHWSALLLDLLADCCKRMLIRSLSKQGFVGDCISLTPVWRALELLVGKTPDEHSL